MATKQPITVRPSGLTITRNKYAFTIRWKIADADYRDGQQLQYWNYNKKAWMNITINQFQVQATMAFNKDVYYPIGKAKMGTYMIRVRGNRRRYSVEDSRTHAVTTYNPTVSAWARQDYIVKKPMKPTLTATLSNEVSNQCTFAWSHDFSTSIHEWCYDLEWQTVLVKNCPFTDGSKCDWKASADGWQTGTSRAVSSKSISEDTALLTGASYTRWFRIHARGPAGDSAWVYARHVYAKPKQAVVKSASVTRSASGGYTCKVVWEAPSSVAYPIDITTVQYAFELPVNGLNCPDNAGWTNANVSRDTSGADAAAFSIGGVVSDDQCLFIRVNTRHDHEDNTTYGKAIIVAAGMLTEPANLSVTMDESTRRANISADNRALPNNASCFLAVIYRTSKNTKDRIIGVIPHGESSVTVQAPSIASNVTESFAVKAVLGSYSYTTDSNGVRSYSITQKMHSTIVKDGGDIPLAPATVTLSKTDDEDTIKVSFSWSWRRATVAEISWADTPNAWESTSQPKTYEIDNTHAGQWYITGLATGKTWYVRVRLKSGTSDGDTYGAYSETKSINLSTAPSIPVLTLSDGVITRKGKVTASWTYSAADGSRQAYAVVAEVVTSGGTTTYHQIKRVTTAKKLTIKASDHNWRTGQTHLLAVRVVSSSGLESDGWSVPVPISIADPLTARITNTNLVAESRNVLENTASTTTNNGVTYTVQDDGTVKATGTATADAGLSIYFTPNAGNYYFNGAIGGSESTYYVFLYDVTDSHMAYQWDGTTTALICTDGESEQFRAEAGHQYRMTLRVKEGTTVNTIFYPMVRKSTDNDDSYEFYHEVLTLKATPLRVTVTGAGAGGRTTITVERAEDYQIDRPDETDFYGFEGETIYSRTFMGEAEDSIQLSELVGSLDDGAAYRIIASVQDGLGQSSTTEKTFVVHWSRQAKMPSATVVVDNENYICKMTPTATNPASGDTCDIYRLSVDRPELIYPNATFGETYVDPYPAIGEFGGHRFVYRTANGDYITNDDRIAFYDTSAEQGDTIESDYTIIDFAGGRILLNRNLDIGNKWKKDFEETQYLGGSVQGDWNPAVSREASVNTVAVSILDQETIQIMRRLAVHAGVCHVRTSDGSSYNADVQVSDKYNHSNGRNVIEYDLSITRVDPETYDGLTLDEWNAIHMEDED